MVDETFSLDERISDAQLIHFASEAKYIQPAARQLFDQWFKGDGSLEYYDGLLRGFWSSTQILAQYKVSGDAPNIIKLAVGYIAEKIVLKQRKKLN